MARVEPRPSLPVEGRATMEPEAIPDAMGQAFDKVMDFQEANGIAADGPPLSVHYGYSNDEIALRAGLFGTGAVTGDVGAGRTAGGRILRFTHTGPYATLRDSRGTMMDFIASRSLELGAPTWEPVSTTPRPRPSTGCGPRSTWRTRDRALAPSRPAA